MLESAGALGWTPDVFWKSTYAELHWFMRGWKQSQGINTDELPYATREDLDELLQLDEKRLRENAKSNSS